jgi:hypothetical protein
MIQQAPRASGVPEVDGQAERSERRACPSAPCIEGALLLGVMTSSGQLAYIQPPTHVDGDFVARAHAKGRPEARYRFSTPCIEADCSQWTGEGCGLADMLVQSVPATATQLPACTIRSSCRWFAQHGAGACAICPTVVADVGGTATHRSTRQDQPIERYS